MTQVWQLPPSPWVPISEVPGLLLETYSACSPRIQQQYLADISLGCDLLQGWEER